MTVEVYNQNRGIPMGAQSLTPSGGGGGGTGGASINDNQVSTATVYSSNKVESRLAEKTGAGLSLGFNATLASETLTFVTTDETPYTLKENYDYEIDLHFPAAGTLTDTIKMVVENNNDTIQFVALTHTDPSQPITVGTMKQLMYYDAETGFRWLFKARYKTTSTGVKVFVIYPVIAKASTPDNMLTTNTDQVITGSKTFHMNQQSKKITLVDAGSTTAKGAYITLDRAGTYDSNIVLGTAYENRYGGKRVTVGVIPLSNTVSAPGIRMYSGSTADATYLVGGGITNCGYLKMSGSELTFTNASGTETNLLASGGGDTSELLTGHGTTKFSNVSLNSQDVYASNEWYNHNNALVAGIYAGKTGTGIKSLTTDRLSVGGYLKEVTYGITLNPATTSSGDNQIKMGSSSSQRGFIGAGGGFGILLNPKDTIYSTVPALTTSLPASNKYPLYSTYNVKAGNGINIDVTQGDTITISATGGAASASDNGIRGDYESRYGIIESPNGILTDAQDSENNLVLTLHQGLVMQCAGQDAKTIVSADTTHTVESTTEFDLFYAGGAFYEAAEVVFSETEPAGSDTGITAWFNPNKTANPDQKWQFKSNANGNTWASSAAGRIAHIHTNGIAITRIDYAGCRILDGQHFLSAAEAAHAAMPSDKYEDITLAASGTKYTAPADGWFYYYISGGISNTVTNAYMRVTQDSLPPIENRATKRDTASSNGSSLMCGWIFVRKGDYTITYRTYSNIEAGSVTRFYYCVGQAPN